MRQTNVLGQRAQACQCLQTRYNHGQRSATVVGARSNRKCRLVRGRNKAMRTWVKVLAGAALLGGIAGHIEQAEGQERAMGEKPKAVRKTLSESGRKELEKRMSITRKGRTTLAQLKRRGHEIPDVMSFPSSPDLPDPLVMNDGTKVTTKEQWAKRREEIKALLVKHHLGRSPPPPDNIRAVELSSEIIPDSGVVRGKRLNVTGKEFTYKVVKLTFGPEGAASIRLALLIPREGTGPYPAIMQPIWVKKIKPKDKELAVARNGFVCVIPDPQDFTDLRRIYPSYNWSTIGNWAWGMSRCMDYLQTLDIIDKDHIAVTGYSRFGKTALVTAAFDERFASMPVAAGHDSPVRSTPLYTGSTGWFLQSLDCFIGREDRLPCDAHFYTALIAPRPLLVMHKRGDVWCNVRGAQDSYLAAKRVYAFLGAEEKIGIWTIPGYHSFTPGDMKVVMEWASLHWFGKKARTRFYDMPFPYEFEEWKKTNGGEAPDVRSHPVRTWKTPRSPEEWKKESEQVRKRVEWVLGEGPQVKLPSAFPSREFTSDLLDKMTGNGQHTHPKPLKHTKTLQVDMGEGVTGYIMLPKELPEKAPALVYLHPYVENFGWFWSWSGYRGERGDRAFYKRRDLPHVPEIFAKAGYVVITYDQLGHGMRKREAGKFYQEHPKWSQLGRMVADARRAVDVLCSLEYVDKGRIGVAGVGLGAKVALHLASSDERVKAVAAIDGISPLRKEKSKLNTFGIRSYAIKRGLAPRMGLFIGSEERLPYDYDDLIGTIAPRHVMIDAAELDWRVNHKELKQCVERAREVYKLLGAEEALKYETPYDYHIFWPDRQGKVIEWFDETLGITK